MNIKVLFVFYLTLLSVSLCHADLGEKQNGAGMEEIVLAGGCFWGMEELFRKQEGVVSTEVGYAGGEASEATYEFVKTGKTAHAEALRVRFDTSKTNLENILRYFFKIHDPTTLDRQGNDIGSQYRSAIFYANENQRVLGASIIDQLEETKLWKRKIVTIFEPLNSFTLAEDYHQDYLQKNPGGYTCHFERDIEF